MKRRILRGLLVVGFFYVVFTRLAKTLAALRHRRVRVQLPAQSSAAAALSRNWLRGF
jgi:hypothetical protein